MDLATLQKRFDDVYGPGDREMGLGFLCMVLMEEVGELAEAARKGDAAHAGREAVDVAFMALAIANVCGQDVERGLVEKFLRRDLDEVSRTWDDVSWKARQKDSK